MIDLEAPGPVRWIARTLEDAGFETWVVGGAVRDALAGTRSGDWDLTTRARPREVQRLFRRTVPIGVDHGTVGVLARSGTLYEVTTFRRDVETTGRHAVVAFADTLDEDLARRDFTINAVAWHPLRGGLHDPFHGRRDLEQGVLRTVGTAADRFSEDYLRVLRAVRFAGTFRLRIEAESWRALTAAVGQLGILSPERIREELEKVLGGSAPPSRALALYAASGVLGFLYPEVDRTVRHPRGRKEAWYGHALRTVDLLSPQRPRLRWAALLQGIGEPEGTQAAGEADSDLGARALLRTAALLERLRCSNEHIREVSELVRCVARPPDPSQSDAELRRWLSVAGRGRVNPLLRIWLAGARADRMREGPWTPERILEVGRRLRRWARSEVPLSVGELAFSGRDLIRMGYRPGKHFGEALDHLLEEVLTDPALNRPESLESTAREWMEEHGHG